MLTITELIKNICFVRDAKNDIAIHYVMSRHSTQFLKIVHHNESTRNKVTVQAATFIAITSISVILLDLFLG